MLLFDDLYSLSDRCITAKGGIFLFAEDGSAKSGNEYQKSSNFDKSQSHPSINLYLLLNCTK